MPTYKPETRQPLIGEDMTVERIRDAIPRNMHVQSTFKSFRYLAQDIAQVALFSAFTYNFFLPAVDAVSASLGYYPGLLLTFLAWNVYWWVQGTLFTALWVLAHECGHGGFSPHEIVNEVVGWVVHSALLVPYHNWRLTHATHHRHTNNIAKDTVFLPSTKTTPLKEAISESPIVSMIHIVGMLTVGWPLHLFFNVAGNDTYGAGANSRVNHFEPSSPLFRKKDRNGVIKGNIGLVIAVTTVYLMCQKYGFANVMFWYGAPYLWTNFWLVLITFLQHTDPRIPHYTPENFNFVKGALATVDRDYGWYLNHVLHHIQDSHVAHHLFSSMPFYNAIEVTEKYLPDILGDKYLCDRRPLWTMLWESWRTCTYIVPSEGVMFFYY